MKYVIRKILSFIMTLGLVSFLVFAAFAVIPGDPALSKLGTDATPSQLAELREEMGLNRPLLVRFADWAVSFVQGDMGVSYSYDRPVAEMILDKLPITLTLAVLAFFLTIVIAFPLGIYAAKHQGSVIDRLIYSIGQGTMAIPPFFLGILLTFLFGIVLKWFTPGGYVSYRKDFLGFARYLFFPALAIALPKAAMTLKLLRGSFIEQMQQDYARTAYSRGNNTKQVLYRHVLKNAMIPVITFLGMTLADMIAGSIIVEQVFSVPGLGRILMTSISGRDYPVVQAIIVWIAVLVLAVNLLVDFVYRLIDPRIRME